MSALRSALYWLFIVFWTLIDAPFVLLRARWGSEQSAYWAARRWRQVVEWGVVHILGIRYEAEGLENMPDAPFVLLSKHQSAWETLFLLDFVPQNRFCVFVLKKELLTIPIVGKAFEELKMIAIDRKNARAALDEMMNQGKNRLANGFVVVIFPEGTRVAPGQKGRYKAGGAQLAKLANVPVIPVAHNAGELWPRNRFVKKSGIVKVKIGKPMVAGEMSTHAFNQQIEEWIETQMADMTSKAKLSNDFADKKNNDFPR